LKKITIVLRHYPPSKNINGILADQMARYLIKDHNVEVKVFCMDISEKGNISTFNPTGNITRIKQKFSNRNKFGKLFNMLYDGYILIRRSKKYPADLIICTSGPPLLPLWASMLLRKKKWAFWSLDLFPEGFVSANTIKENNWIYQFLLRKTYKNPPDLLISLGNEQAKYIQKQYKKTVPVMILPAGVTLEEEQDVPDESKPDWYNPGKIILGYFGNAGQANNPEFIKEMIRVSGEPAFRFILSVYGINAEEIKAFARNFEHVVIVEGGIAQEHLKYIDVHLVTLRTSWTHAAVPSKAVTAISTGRPIVFCGSEESDNWQMFKDAAWFIPENENMKSEVARLLAGINREQIESKAALTKDIVVELKRQVLNTYTQLGKYDQ